MLDGTNATFTYVDKDGFAVANPTFAYDGTAHTCAKTSLTYTGKDLKEARKNAYAATEWVTFENKYMRHDIGKAIDDVEA